MAESFSTVNRQRLCVLGSTGSIGANTLDVVSRHPDRFEVFALSGGRRVEELLAQCVQWHPRFVVMPREEDAQRLRQALADAGLRTEVLTSSYVGSHYEYDVKLGNQVVQVESSRPGLAGQVCLVFEPDHALVYPEAVELSEEERDLLTVA